MAQPIAGGTHCGWSHPWEVGLSEPWKQASKQLPTASAPAFGFLPCVPTCPDFLWWWAVLWKCKARKHFPPGCCTSSRHSNPVRLWFRPPGQLSVGSGSLSWEGVYLMLACFNVLFYSNFDTFHGHLCGIPIPAIPACSLQAGSPLRYNVLSSPQ